MPRFAVLLPLLAPWVRLSVSLFWRLGPGLSAFLPCPVRALLAAPGTRAELIRLVSDVAGCFLLTNAERREQAILDVGDWLREHDLALHDRDLALLVELLYGWLKRHRPQVVAPTPLPFGEQS
jgi:hypothetical protein